MGWCCCAGDFRRGLLRESVAFPWNAAASLSLVSALYADRKPRAFFPIRHVCHGIHGEPTMGKRSRCRGYGRFFLRNPVSIHSVAPERDHECALSRRSRCCRHRSYSYCLLLAGPEQGVDAIHWIGWRIADGLCRSCTVTLQYLPATQHPAEGQNEADDCCQHDPKRL